MPTHKRPTTVYQYLKHANALMSAAESATTTSERARLEHGYKVQLELAKAKMEAFGAQVDYRQLKQMAQAVNKGKK